MKTFTIRVSLSSLHSDHLLLSPDSSLFSCLLTSDSFQQSSQRWQRAASRHFAGADQFGEMFEIVPVERRHVRLDHQVTLAAPPVLGLGFGNLKSVSHHLEKVLRTPRPLTRPERDGHFHVHAEIAQ